MNNIRFLGFAVLAALAPMATRAQDANAYGVSTPVSAVSVAASGTSNVNAIVSVTKNENLALAVSVVGSTNIAAGNVLVAVQKSIDGSAWVSVGTLTNALNGNTNAHYVAEYSVGAVGYYRIQSVQNASTNAAATVTVKAATKKF